MSDDPFVQGFEELRQDYRSKGLAGRVGFGSRPAIVVVDLIRGFTDPQSPFGSDLDAEVKATNELTNVARARGIPVIFSTIVYDPSLRDAGLWIRKITSNKHLVEGSEWVEVDPRLDRQPGETVVVKKYASCFFGTDLMSQLQVLGVDTVVIAGCTTSGCVRATTVDACSLGLHTIVVEEAVGDRARLPHLAALFDMDAKYGDVVPLREAIDHLDGSSHTPHQANPEEHHEDAETASNHRRGAGDAVRRGLRVGWRRSGR